MKHFCVVICLIMLTAKTALGGGVERSTQSVNILFEPGRYAEFSVNYLTPRVAGQAPGGQPSESVVPAYLDFSLGYKMAVGPHTSLALIIDQPVGASISYPPGTDYPLAGSRAAITSRAVTGAVRYRTERQISIFGGLRGVRTRGEVELASPAQGGTYYTMHTDRDNAWGYLLGLGYELPELAMRFTLTYNSPIKHSFRVTELDRPAPSFSTTIPRSVNLNFQTGLTPELLLFGSARWVRWQEFDITPVVHADNFGDSLLAYRRNTITWRLGLGRKFSPSWSGAISLACEPGDRMPVANLGPTSGRQSIVVAATYRRAAGLSITNALMYSRLGNATTSRIGGSFRNNRALGVGTRIGYHF